MNSDDRSRDVPEVFNFYYRPAFWASFVQPQQATSTPGAEPPPALQPSIWIWTQHPAALGYKQDVPSKTYMKVDLTKTPSKEAHSACVEVDDHVNTNGGFTTFGPMFPHAYGAASVYLRCRNNDDWANMLPDLTAVVVRPPRGDIRRYHGFIGLHLNNNIWVIYHPGSANREHGRAPRKLAIPDDKTLTTGVPAGTRLGDSSITSIYLDREYALYAADLDIPKKPSGSGEKIFLRVAGSARANAESPAPAPAPMPMPMPMPMPVGCVHDNTQATPCNLHLNVLGAVTTGEIQEIANNLKKNYLQLKEGDTLYDALSRYVSSKEGQGKTFDSLDLIGHSRSRDNILKLGEFALTSRVIAQQFKKLSDEGILDKLQINSIRLLGCRTACSPRARHVVETILEYFPRIKVWAARADLFAVHYDSKGLRPEATPLLADQEVITTAGPGDLPPGDDYPPDPPNDDDDDDDGGDNSTSPSTCPFPFQLVVAALSDPNKATMAARSFLYWPTFEESFDTLVKMVHSKTPTLDNALLRSDCEVLVAISATPKTISDYRSFDIIIDPLPSDPLPRRIRVYGADGTAYAFPFLSNDKATITSMLNDNGIKLSEAHQLPDFLDSWI